jgi:8-amino-7-oxononanoate synthase
MSFKRNDWLSRELQSGLSGLEVRNQRRSLSEMRGVNLCSNDYLGLSEHADLRAAILEAVKDAPRVGGTGSRLLSGHFAVWDEVEEEFAQFAGTETALYFGSGYAANLGVLTSLLTKSDLVFSDERNHASLIDGIRLSGARKIIYPHLDLDALESALRQHDHETHRRFLVTETVFSMDGDVVAIADLVDLCDRFGAALIFDEAHATAVHGPAGRGIAAGAAALDRVAAVIHPCGKGLASAGAFVCGSALLREHLINHARTLLFGTALPPYMAKQIRAALRLALKMDPERADLLSRSRRLVAGLRDQGYDTAGSSTQIVPVVLGGNDEAMAAAEYLQHQGFAVRAIRPPTVKEGSARIRLSITCAIAPRELERLASCLASWREQKCAHAAGCA